MNEMFGSRGFEGISNNNPSLGSIVLKLQDYPILIGVLVLRFM